MSELAILAEHVSKEYRLGAIGHGTLRRDLQSWWAQLRHKEDPNSRVGVVTSEKGDCFLALDDLSLAIGKGESLGILGHNGAGKSTLLKLICHITSPTSGDIYINGRITSMLEIGTGFHPELTGRENIYLNGAILGMRKSEIERKFDRIVEFSEVGRFIDTPVKRYSSGMRVRLAFSIASHLDSEIMVMDEVLAVGDVAFQNKCIARMKEVASQEGRTILYVSHNMSTVRNLCQRCIVLAEGRKIFDGGTDEAIAAYMRNRNLAMTTCFDVSETLRTSRCNLRHQLLKLELPEVQQPHFTCGETFRFRITWESEVPQAPLWLKLHLKTIDGLPVGVVLCGCLSDGARNGAQNQADFLFDTSYLTAGQYLAEVVLYNEDGNGNTETYDRIDALRFILEPARSRSSTATDRNGAAGHAVLPCIRPC